MTKNEWSNLESWLVDAVHGYGQLPTEAIIACLAFLRCRFGFGPISEGI